MEKNKKIILIFASCLIGILLISGIFIAIKNISFSNSNQENNVTNEIVDKDENNNDNDDNNQEEVNYDYKLVKVIDYDFDENWDGINSPNIWETKSYYVVDTVNLDNPKVILFDKEGNNVTKKVFGVENITYIDGLDDEKERLIVSTTDNKYGLYDSNFKELVKIGNYVIDRADNDNYFMIGDSIENPDELSKGEITGVLKNVGVYNKNGKLIIPREYERLYLGGMYNGNHVYETDQILFYARKNGKYGFINENNEVVVPFNYDHEGLKYVSGSGDVFTVNKNTYFILYKNGKYGMIDENNKVIIEFNKNKLFYYEYANVVVEKIYDKDDIGKLNIYNLSGKLKKEIKTDDNLKAVENANHYSVGEINFVLCDKEYVYILNKNLEYDKYKGSTYSDWGLDSNLFLAGKNYYLKEKNEKYQVYKTSDDSLMMKDEFYLYSELNGFILCKNKTKNDNYSECGIIGFDGEIKLDFKYESNTYSSLKNGNEVIEYDYETNMFKKNEYQINGQCLKDVDDYYFYDKVVNIEGDIYDYNCNKIMEDVDNVYSINDDLIMTEVFRNDEHNKYLIYDLNTLELAKIENNDKVRIIGELGDGMLVATNKGIYKIVKN